MRICFIPSPLPSQARVDAALVRALRASPAPAHAQAPAAPLPCEGATTAADVNLTSAAVDVHELKPGASDDICALAASLVAPRAPYEAVVVHIDNTELLELIVQAVRYEGVDDCSTRDLRPAIVVLSSFNTWCGRLQSSDVVDCVAERFSKRHPHPSALRTFALENRLCGLQASGLARVRLVVAGLVYGEGGLHFESILRSMHAESGDVELFSTSQGQNIVPMVHVEDLARLILHQTTASADAFASVASDGNKLSLRDMLKRMGADVDGLVRFCARLTPNNNTGILMWNMNVVCELSDAEKRCLLYPCGLSERLPAIWAQFVAANGLQPLSFVVTGPPLCGKTAVAQELCVRAGLRYINTTESIRFVMASTDEKAAATRAEVQSCLEAKMQEAAAAAAAGAKKGKAAAAPEAVAAASPPDFSGAALTPELCAQVPEELARSCIFAQISLDGRCQKKGYVVDAWLKGISAISHAKDAILGQAAAAAQIDPKLLERQLWIEFQAESATLSHRFLRSIGLDPAQNNAKLNKDQQASISKFEAIVKEYYENCSIVGESSAEAASGACSTSGPRTGAAREAALAPFQSKGTTSRVHKTVGAIEAELGVAVLRIMTSNERPVLDVAEDVLRAYRGAWAGDGAAVMELPKNVEGDCAAQATALVQSDGPPQPTPELGRSLDSLNFLLSGLTSDAIDVLACSNARLQTYFADNLYPHLSEMLVRIERERPEDPLKFACAFLDGRAALLEEQAGAAARSRFLQTVATAAALENRAATELLNARVEAESF